MATRGVRRETILSRAAPLQTVTTKSSALAALATIPSSALGNQHGASIQLWNPFSKMRTSRRVCANSSARATFLRERDDASSRAKNAKKRPTAACRASKTPAGASCVHRHRLVAGCPITICARRRTSALLRFRLLLRKKGRSQHSSFRQWIAPSLRQVRYVPPPALYRVHALQHYCRGRGRPLAGPWDPSRPRRRIFSPSRCRTRRGPPGIRTLRRRPQMRSCDLRPRRESSRTRGTSSGDDSTTIDATTGGIG